MTIKILTGFDGSCPHSDEGVKKESCNTFTVYPGYRKEDGFSEENSRQGGSRFYIRIENDSIKSESVDITADWQIPARVCHHDQGYIKQNGGDWGFLPCIRTAETKIKYSLYSIPGITELALFPEYNYSQCKSFVESLASEGIKIETVGQSEDGRDMWMVEFASDNPRAESFFIQARDHAYETAGSYCVEGIVEFLKSEDFISKYIRSKFNFHIVPMTNPDGVYRGMSRLTREKGADMNRLNTVSDKAHDNLKKTIDRIAPKVHMNIHNWTNKFMDGLLVNDEEIKQRILFHFTDDRENYKHWHIETHADYLRANNITEAPENSKSWKNYCKEKFGAYGVNFEFPWFAILPNGMKQKGKKALTAYALSAIDAMKL
ncbi:MAG: hypothetical protein A2017_15390 [Lentisphaerae bacterium GWF2_44_16]|nr:MAG: hypothetical protein A2017_15390 [Lentisphaerae bacterium GWF2_44_16]